ncbi:MAG: hypothetical protein IPN53_15710 [Comamonadaceae bacterium]|nr:hypothetical protein [Comamonadaceae bacterium]
MCDLTEQACRAGRKPGIHDVGLDGLGQAMPRQARFGGAFWPAGAARCR